MRMHIHIGELEPGELYQRMEHSSYLWRSMYVDHLKRWLKAYPPSAMLVIPFEALKSAHTLQRTMERFATMLGLPRAGPEVHAELITKASPASTDGSVHENGRAYVGKISPSLEGRINQFLCPKSKHLAQLLLETKLVGRIDDFPWLAKAVKDGNACAD